MDNGTLSGATKSIYKSYESVSFTCDTGFIPNTNATSCLATKVWSPPPVCNIVNCTVATLNNGQYKTLSDTGTWVSANKSSYTYGTTLKVKCNKWYEITDGSSNLTCLENGSWGPSNVQCVKIFCNNSTDVSHVSINNYPELGVGETGNVSYNTTHFYITQGSLEVKCNESRRFIWTTAPLFGKVSYTFAINSFVL